MHAKLGSDIYKSSMQGHMLLPLMCLAALSFLPSGLDFYFDLKSHAVGTAMGCLVVIALLAIYVQPPRTIARVIITTFLIASHLAIVWCFAPVELVRAFFSLCLITLILIAGHYLAFWLFQLPDRTIDWVSIVFTWLLLLIAVLSIVGIQPFFGVYRNKPVFPFTEPSHYALILTPLIIDACIRSQNIQRYWWIIVGLAIAYVLNSLTLIIGVGIAFLISFSLSRLVLAGAVIFSLVTYLVGTGHVDLAYFSDRLDFTVYSSNLSSLVYIQGWELITDSLLQTWGWGIGFQQLGFYPLASAASDAIYRIYHLELNVTDGGFVAAKLLSEFGVFGAIIVFVFINVAIRMAMRLRSRALNKAFMPSGERFAYAFFCGYSIEMFVRGIGYFSGTTVIVVAAYIYYRNYRPPDCPINNGNR